MNILGYEIFMLMSDFVGSQFAAAMDNAYVNSAAAVAVIGSVVMAIWFTVYGIRMAYGLPGHTMSDFMWRSAKAAFVLAIVAAATTENLSIQNLVTTTRDDLVQAITNDSRSVREQTELGLAGLDLFQFLAGVMNGDNAADEANTLSLVLAMVGQGSPAIVGGVLLLLNELAIRIGIAVGPLMLFALLFDSTKDLFFSWIRLLLASVLNMAILAVVVAEAAVLMGVFVAVMLAAKLADTTGVIFTDLQTSMAQAGFGIMLSALIYTVPQMAARYFGGGMMVGAYNLFSGLRVPGAGGASTGGSNYAGVNGPTPGQPYGQPSVTPPMPAPTAASRGLGSGIPQATPGGTASTSAPPAGASLMGAPSGIPASVNPPPAVPAATPRSNP